MSNSIPPLPSSTQLNPTKSEIHNNDFRLNDHPTASALSTTNVTIQSVASNFFQNQGTTPVTFQLTPTTRLTLIPAQPPVSSSHEKGNRLLEEMNNILSPSINKFLQETVSNISKSSAFMIINLLRQKEMIDIKKEAGLDPMDLYRLVYYTLQEAIQKHTLAESLSVSNLYAQREFASLYVLTKNFERIYEIACRNLHEIKTYTHGQEETRVEDIFHAIGDLLPFIDSVPVSELTLFYHYLQDDTPESLNHKFQPHYLQEEQIDTTLSQPFQNLLHAYTLAYESQASDIEALHIFINGLQIYLCE